MTIKSKGFAKFDQAFMVMLQGMYDDIEQGRHRRTIESDLDAIHGFVTGLMHSGVLTIREYSTIWDALTSTYVHMVYGTSTKN